MFTQYQYLIMESVLAYFYGRKDVNNQLYHEKYKVILEPTCNWCMKRVLVIVCTWFFPNICSKGLHLLISVEHASNVIIQITDKNKHKIIMRVRVYLKLLDRLTGTTLEVSK